VPQSNQTFGSAFNQPVNLPPTSSGTATFGSSAFLPQSTSTVSTFGNPAIPAQPAIPKPELQSTPFVSSTPVVNSTKISEKSLQAFRADRFTFQSIPEEEPTPDLV
jgi:hypothetical protein